MRSWIVLSRKLRDSGIWTERRTFSRAEAWIDLLLSVADDHGIEDLPGGGTIETRAGQLITTLDVLAGRWSWHRSRVRRFLDDLERQGMAATEAVGKRTLVTLTNWETYQSSCFNAERTKEQSFPEKPTSYAQSRNDLRNDNPVYDPDAGANVQSKKDFGSDSATQIVNKEQSSAIEPTGYGYSRNDVENPIPYREDYTITKQGRKRRKVVPEARLMELASASKHGRSDLFAGAWRDWIEARSELGKPITEKAATAQLELLERYVLDDAVEIIRTSIRNQWQGLFPVKQTGQIQHSGNASERYPVGGGYPRQALAKYRDQSRAVQQFLEDFEVVEISGSKFWQRRR